MQPQSEDRDNNFAVARLSLAALVVLAHSPELVDGNRSREILTGFCGTLSFGEVAVDGFFVISGYLLTKSFSGKPCFGTFMERRCLRIVPGYAVCFLICLSVSIFAGGDWSCPGLVLGENFARLLLLQTPHVAHVFAGSHYPDLNGAAWTIAYEFRCYLLVPLLGQIGLWGSRAGINRTVLLACLAAVVLLGLALNAFDVLAGQVSPLPLLTGSPASLCRLASVFGIGSLLYLARSRYSFNGTAAIGATVALVAMLCWRQTAEIGVALFGGYIILFLALGCAPTRVGLLLGRDDISFGLYLYAWPIAKLLLWLLGPTNPWLHSVIVLAGAGLAGYLSWSFIERPALTCRSRKRIVRMAPSSHTLCAEPEEVAA